MQQHGATAGSRRVAQALQNPERGKAVASKAAVARIFLGNFEIGSLLLRECIAN